MLINKPVIKNLTINECRQLLNETLHRTEFLNNFKDSVFKYVLDCLETEVYSSKMSIINDYVDGLYIKIDIKNHDNINSNKQYANYFNEDCLVKGKLCNAELDIFLYKDSKGRFNFDLLRVFIDHEINHLYDDWQWQKNGHEPIIMNSNLRFKINTINEFLESRNGLIKTIGWCLYLSIETENNSFINQVYSELSGLKCNKQNIHKKIKSTHSYRNYNKIVIDMKYYINELSDSELEILNSNMINYYHGLNIPMMNLGEFNADEFRNRLIKWCESIKMKFIKRYCGIVQYYLDNQNKMLSGNI